MPYATLCPNCSHQWTLVEAVSRSWFCPRCGGGRSTEQKQLLCACGHSYAQHDTMRRIENSLEGFTLPGNALPRDIAALPKGAAPSSPPLGRCTACHCNAYRHIAGR